MVDSSIINFYTEYMIVFGDCRETMRKWAAQGIKAQMCVTSPPYYGLRDYGHEGQIGLEQTPEEYIAAMVEVFRAVSDVLANDGTLWLNIGDSYYNHRTGYNGALNRQSFHKGDNGKPTDRGQGLPRRARKFNGIKEKDLFGIPWMLAFALRSDGWYLRQEIIWSKTNPTPESMRDRCTKSHEQIFLLTKSQSYYFDVDAIMERAGETKRRPRSVWSVPVTSYRGAHFATFPPALIEPCILAGSRQGDTVLDPFMGSGTTAMVAIQNGRRYIGCELNREYEPLQKQRIASVQYSDPLI